MSDRLNKMYDWNFLKFYCNVRWNIKFLFVHGKFSNINLVFVVWVAFVPIVHDSHKNVKCFELLNFTRSSVASILIMFFFFVAVQLLEAKPVAKSNYCVYWHIWLFYTHDTVVIKIRIYTFSCLGCLETIKENPVLSILLSLFEWV